MGFALSYLLYRMLVWYIRIKVNSFKNMTTYIAFLRGINVGGKCKVSMKELKEVFESLGYENVTTYINSGNVLFDAKKEVTAPSIDKALKKNFGFDIRVVVRTEKNILKLAKSIPQEWFNDKKQRTYVFFLWDEFDSKKSLDLITIKEGIDNLKYISGAIVWNFLLKDYKKSGMNKLIGTELYKNMTSRNVNTVRKLVGLLEARK